MKPSRACAAVLALLALSLSACGNFSGGDDTTDVAFNVIYYPNGATSGTVPTDGSDYAAGAAMKVKGNTGGLVKTGFDFSGWNTKADGSGTTYTQGQLLIIGKADVKLYARWTTNPTSTVTYDANGATGGSVPVDTTHYEAGQTVTVQGNTEGLVKTNYDFAGWNTKADGSGTSYAAGASFPMGNANVTLYARWISNLIYTDTDLFAVREYLSGHYTLMADIDLSTKYSAGWTPIGTAATPFTGTFNGNNHTIGNLTVSSAGDYQGLFGYASGATIQNLNLTGAAVAGGNYVGALVGYSASSTISSCSAAGTSITGTNNVGGLLGYSSGTVSGTSGSYCNTGFITISGTIPGSSNVGGFIGNNAGAVQYCYSSSTVSCNPSNSYGIGGFIGNNTAAISYCYVTGTVTGNYNVGGLIGVNSGPVTYSHASATATVTGTDMKYSGGLIGWNSTGGPVDYCYAANNVVGSGGSCYDTGGLVGRNFDAITNCYATGNVSGSVNVAGLVGLLRSPGTVGYCYATGVVSGGYGLIAQMETTCTNSYFNSANTDNSYGTATSLANMQLQATYAGWDFSTIWAINGAINGGYPYLVNIAP